MKKYIALFLAILTIFSLCACAKGSGDGTKEKPTYTYPEYPEEAAAYSVEQMDHSTYDTATGEPFIEAYYQKVVLEGDSEAIKAVNALIEEDYNRYVNDNAVDTFEETFSTHPAYSTESPFIFTHSAAVTHNEDNILSIRIIQESFFGGVFNVNSYGMTFDTETGKAVTLIELTDMSEEELLATLVDVTWSQIHYDDLFPDAKETLESLTLDDYLFYVELGEIVLAFPTYTFGPGAAGSTTIQTGIMIK